MNMSPFLTQSPSSHNGTSCRAPTPPPGGPPTRGQVVAVALVALTLYGMLGMALWWGLVLGLRLLGVR